MVLDDSDMAPRDRKQVENVKYALNKQERKESGKVGHQTNLADEIVSLVRDISGREHEFIKELVHIGGQPPSVILYTAEQLHDFATSEKTVFGVDRTFNLGPCFVTLIVYKSKKLLRKSSQENPVMLGPIYLHWNATFFTYTRFFTHISAKLAEKGMKNLDSITLGLSDLIIGSDEELALNKATKHSFPGATLLLCTRHLEENAKRHLNAESTEQSKKQETINEIFGRNGLLTMDDSYEFDEKYQRMRLKFDKDFPRFAKYYSEKLVPALRSHVFQPQRKHNLPFKWTNNNCKSMNHIFKLQIDWKPQKITDLIDTLERIVQLQYQDMKRALYGEGSYQLAPGYSTHKIARIIWISKSKNEKEALFMKFLKSKAKQRSKEQYVTSIDGLYTIPRMPRVAKKPCQTKRPRNAKTRTIRVVTGRIRSGLKSTVEADEGLQGVCGQTGTSVPEIDCRRMEPHHVTGRVRSGLKSTVKAVDGLQGVCGQTGISVPEIDCRRMTGRVRSGLKSTVEADEGLQGVCGQTGISVTEIDCRRMEPHHVTGRVRSGLKSTEEAVEGLQGVCGQTGISVPEIDCRRMTGRVRSGLKSTVEADEGLQGVCGQTGISVTEIDCRRMEPHHVTVRVRSGLKSTEEAVEGLQGVCGQTGISVPEIDCRRMEPHHETGRVRLGLKSTVEADEGLQGV
ncbi:uncharacterized protein LOC143024181 isoform X2 [Oratosquilla oratoria]|uniref:uncharacterized protein LOC143024181 isoform X2 n=1 Tax=Oratosquilla oratoria TaxID=337810 RepID=UPI003F759810